MLLGYNLTDFALRVISTLFIYRGMTATQLARMLYPQPHTLSEEKSVYNVLGKLKKQKLVSSTRLQGDFSRGSIYYLTQKGYDFGKYWLNVKVEQNGDGWINADFPTFADIPYETYKPPLEQTTHHLMLIEFFIELQKINHLDIDYRLNLYASENYISGEEKLRFRPDAEVKLADGRRVAIEIDRGTESHLQLCNKFQTYRSYLGYESKNEDQNAPAAILFVVENKRRDHGLKRRWINIASAFYKEIGQYHQSVNLIMTTFDKIESTFTFEDNRVNYEIQAIKAFKKRTDELGYKLVSYSRGKGAFQENAFAYVLLEDKYRVYFNGVCHPFETKIYSRLMQVSPYMSGVSSHKDIVDGMPFSFSAKLIYYLNEEPFLFDYSPYEIPKELVEVLRSINDKTKFRRLESSLSN